MIIWFRFSFFSGNVSIQKLNTRITENYENKNGGSATVQIIYASRQKPTSSLYGTLIHVYLLKIGK